MEGEGVESRLAVAAVDEGKVMKINFALNVVHILCFVGVCNGRLFFENLLDPSDGGSTLRIHIDGIPAG